MPPSEPTAAARLLQRAWRHTLKQRTTKQLTERFVSMGLDREHVIVIRCCLLAFPVCLC